METYKVKKKTKVQSCLFISQRMNSGIFSVLIVRKGPKRLNVKLKATITLHYFSLTTQKCFNAATNETFSVIHAKLGVCWYSEPLEISARHKIAEVRRIGRLW